MQSRSIVSMVVISLSDIAKVIFYFLLDVILLFLNFEMLKSLIKKIRRYIDIKNRLKKENTGK